MGRARGKGSEPRSAATHPQTNGLYRYRALTASKWDVIVIMLGTNDAHNDCGTPASRIGCSSDWARDCGGPENTSLANCRFAEDFASLVSLVKTLGTTPTGPKVYVMTPTPMMAHNKKSPAMQTTINTLLPKLFPLMAKATKGVAGLINAYKGMGGTPDWKTKFPPSYVCSLAP